MNRRQFFKAAGLTTAAVVCAPLVKAAGKPSVVPRDGKAVDVVSREFRYSPKGQPMEFFQLNYGGWRSEPLSPDAGRRQMEKALKETGMGKVKVTKTKRGTFSIEFLGDKKHWWQR